MTSTGKRSGGPRAGALVLLGAALLVALVVLAQRERRAPSAATPGESATTLAAAPVVLTTPATASAEPERVALEPSAPARAPGAPATASMRGTILVDGRPPEWPVPLEFAQGPPGTASPRFDPDADAFALVRGVVVPDEGGVFDFGEFPPGWSGRLKADGYTFEDGAPELVLDAPRADLRLALRAPPEIGGRLVDPRTHAPVADVSVRAWLRWRIQPEERLAVEHGAEFAVDVSDDEEHIETRRVSSNARGRFRIALHGRGERNGELLVESAGRWRRALTLPTFQAEQGLELGDVELAPAFEQRFRLLDADGRPIANGLAVDVVRNEQLARSDADGRGVLDCLPPEGLALRFSAPGYRDEARTLLPGEPLEIRLRRTTLLVLRLVSPQGEFERVRVRLSAAEPLFVPFEVRSDWHRLYANGQDARRERELGVGGDGVLRGADLLPGVPFQIQILCDDAVLATRSAELVADEWLTLEIPVTLPARPERVPFRGSSLQRFQGR